MAKKTRSTGNSSNKSTESGSARDLTPEKQGELCFAHVRFGWLCLAIFLTLGIALEALHGFKSQWYLNVANETRRLMLTLGHAHGTLLALVNLGLAATLHCGFLPADAGLKLSGRLLMIATVMMPAGFILGGIQIFGGDPGPGIILVPVAAVFLLTAVIRICLSLKSHH